MNNSKKSNPSGVIVFILCILILVVSRLANSGVLTGNNKSEEKKEDVGEIYYTSLAISERLNKEIDNGLDGDVTLWISNEIGGDELQNVNLTIDTSKGRITSITTYGEGEYGSNPSGDTKYYKAEFAFEKSDSMYVLDYLKKGKNIPPEKVNATRLSIATKEALQACIKEGMSDYEKELAFHDYIVNNCKYSFSDQNDGTEYEAFGALVNRKAVCSGYAAAMDLLLKCEGIDTKIVSGTAGRDAGSKESHAWNQVKIDGNWYNVDATWDDPIGEENILTHEYLNVDDRVLQKDHVWDRNDAEICTSMDANYYSKKGAYLTDVEQFKGYVSVELMAQNKTIDCALKNVDISNEDLQFVFDYNGGQEFNYSESGSGEYKIFTIYIK